MKDPESAEMKEKSYFRFCSYYFFGIIVVFVLKITPIFDEFSPITRKIKILNFFYYFIIFIFYYSAHLTFFIKF